MLGTSKEIQKIKKVLVIVMELVLEEINTTVHLQIVFLFCFLLEIVLQEQVLSRRSRANLLLQAPQPVVNASAIARILGFRVLPLNVCVRNRRLPPLRRSDTRESDPRRGSKLESLVLSVDHIGFAHRTVRRSLRRFLVQPAAA